MPKLESLLIGATAVLILGVFVWSLIQVLPRDALPGPEHPEYAQRLAVAPAMTALNRRFSPEAYRRAEIKNNPLVDDIVATHPDVTPQQIEEIRGLYASHARASLDDLKTATERLYARTYGVDEITAIGGNSVPRLSLTRVRLFLTAASIREDLTRIRQEVRDRTAERYETKILPALERLGVAPPE